MAYYLQIVLLVAFLAASCVSAQFCPDICFCPPGNIMNCDYKGLSLIPQGDWPNVASLNFIGNEITAITKTTFSGLPGLYVLYMSYNTKLTDIDFEGVSFLKNMQMMNFENSGIQRLVPATSEEGLENLIYIFLNNNSISSIDPETFQVASKLVYLFLNYNQIVVPKGQPVLNHPTLELLHMQYGSTLNVGPETFAGLPSLRECVLISAGITTITGAFVTNTKLTTLALLNNLITEVTAGTLSPGNNVSGFYLDNNPLERLDVAAVSDGLADGASISIDNTPLACSCEYEDLYWWAQENGVSLRASCDGVNKCSFTKRTRQ